MPSIYLSTLRSQFWYSSSTPISSHAIGQDGAVFWVCHGLPKSPTVDPETSPLEAVLRCRPIGCKTSLPRCRLCRFAQGKSRRFRGMDVGFTMIHHDAMTPALKLAMAGHIKKNQSKSFNILQMYATPYLYVYGNGCGFVCVPGPTSYV